MSARVVGGARFIVAIWVTGVVATSSFAATGLYKASDLGVLDGKPNQTQMDDLSDSGLATGRSAGQNVTWSVSRGLRPVSTDSDVGFYRIFVNRAGTYAGLGISQSQPAERYPLLVDHKGRRQFFLAGTWAADSIESIEDLADSGEVIGTSSKPWIWSPGAGLRAIVNDQDRVGIYRLNRLNDRGQVVGSKTADFAGCDEERAFVYQSSSATFLPIDGGPPDIGAHHCSSFTVATAINDSGFVVGYRREGSVNSGFVWSATAGMAMIQPADRAMQDLTPMDINERGQVVGTFGYADQRQVGFFYWDNQSGAVDLQTLLDPGDAGSLQLQLAYKGGNVRINSAGVIMMEGHFPDERSGLRSFLLTPVGH